MHADRSPPFAVPPILSAAVVNRGGLQATAAGSERTQTSATYETFVILFGCRAGRRGGQTGSRLLRGESAPAPAAPADRLPMVGIRSAWAPLAEGDLDAMFDDMRAGPGERTLPVHLFAEPPPERSQDRNSTAAPRDPAHAVLSRHAPDLRGHARPGVRNVDVLPA